MWKLKFKKIFTILRSKFLLICTYDAFVFFQIWFRVAAEVFSSRGSPDEYKLAGVCDGQRECNASSDRERGKQNISSSVIPQRSVSSW